MKIKVLQKDFENRWLPIKLPYYYQFADLTADEFKFFDNVLFSIPDANVNVIYVRASEMHLFLKHYDDKVEELIQNGSLNSYKYFENLKKLIVDFKQKFEAFVQTNNTQVQKRNAYLNAIWMALVLTIWILCNGVLLNHYHQWFHHDFWVFFVCAGFLSVVVFGLYELLSEFEATFPIFNFLWFGINFLLFLLSEVQINKMNANVILGIGLFCLFILLEIIAGFVHCWMMRSSLPSVWKLVGEGIKSVMYKSISRPEFGLDEKSKQLKKLN